MLGSRSTHLPAALLFVCGALLLESCATEPPPGQVMLLVSTNLAIPIDADTLRVTLTRSGQAAPFSDDAYALRGDPHAAGDGTKYLPGTLALASNDESRGFVVVHLELRQGGAEGLVRVARDAELLLPREGVKQLPMPLDFLCSRDNLSEPCPTGTTCQLAAHDAGSGEQRCAASKIADSSALDDYVAAPPQACFDVQKCFAIVDGTNATVPQREDRLGGRCALRDKSRILGAVDVNVALVVDAAALGNVGVCDGPSGTCLVPLDQGPEGWQTLLDASNQPAAIGLPDAVCEVGTSVLSVAVTAASAACPLKRASVPLCPAHDTCIPASKICPLEWSGFSCSGNAQPSETTAAYAFCQKVAAESSAPGLVCCTADDAEHHDPLLIDDMSAGPLSKLPAPKGLMNGAWFTQTDDLNSVIEPAPGWLFKYRDLEPPEALPDGTTVSHAACLRAPQGFVGYFAVEGFNLFYTRSERAVPVPVDVSSHTGISFWAKAAPGPFDFIPTEINVAISNTDTSGEYPDSTCVQAGKDKCDDFREFLSLTSDWKLYEITWDELRQQGYGLHFEHFEKRVYAILFNVNGLGDTRSLPFDFCVTRIKFMDQ